MHVIPCRVSKIIIDKQYFFQAAEKLVFPGLHLAVRNELHPVPVTAWSVQSSESRSAHPLLEVYINLAHDLNEKIQSEACTVSAFQPGSCMRENRPPESKNSLGEKSRGTHTPKMMIEKSCKFWIQVKNKKVTSFSEHCNKNTLLTD